MWFSLHYRPNNSWPFVIRSAIKLNVSNLENFLNQNDLDLGLLFGRRNKPFYIESSLSYRYRFRGVEQYTFGFNFDKPGNEVHYKLDVGKICLHDLAFSGFIVGYLGFDKSLRDKKISDSSSSKISIGARLHLGPLDKSYMSILFMVDVFGRNEYAGWTLDFSFGRN